MQKPLPSTLPLTPGIYIYKNAQGRIIYVGKARVLRKRILSYFREEGLPVKTQALMRHAASLDTISTTTEKEALLLEASLIKKHRPHYNIVLRDDKQYILFKISINHPFPRLEIVRSTPKKGREKARYFGPFTSALAARETWKIIHKAFPLRRCTDRAMRNRVRPCLYHFMGQCPAPCMEKITSLHYYEGVQKVQELLSGRSAALLESLQQEMLAASEALEFEKAATLRDQWHAVQRTVEKQVVVLPGGKDLDIIGLSCVEKGMALGILFVRSGVLMDGRNYFWPALDFEDTPELLLSFLAQFYGPITPPPHIILPWLPQEEVPQATPHYDEIQVQDTCQDSDETQFTTRESFEEKQENSMFTALEQSLSDLRQAPVRIIAPRSPEEHALVDMAATNAKEEGRKHKEQPLEERLAKALHLSTPPHRIECVDVSHTGGQQTRVGMVVFEGGKPLPSAYRQYIMPDGTSDDYATLALWVQRRLQSGPPWPDVLLIDGGKGQLSAVQRALQEHGPKYGQEYVAEQSPTQAHEDTQGQILAQSQKALQKQEPDQGQGHVQKHVPAHELEQGGELFALAAIAKARDEQGHADRRAGNVSDRIFLPNRSNPLPLREGSPELLFLQHIRDCTHRYAIGKHRQARNNAALSGELMRIPGIGPHTARLLWDHFSNTDAMIGASQEELSTIKGIGKKKAEDLWQKLQHLRK